MSIEFNVKNNFRKLPSPEGVKLKKEKMLLTLPSLDEINAIKESKENKLKKILRSAATDFAILTGSNAIENIDLSIYNKKLQKYKEEQFFWTKTPFWVNHSISCCNQDGMDKDFSFQEARYPIIRPILKVSRELIDKLCEEQGNNEIVEFGMYPQDVASSNQQSRIRKSLIGFSIESKINKTNEYYTTSKVKTNDFNKSDFDNLLFSSVFIYEGLKYIKIHANNRCEKREKFRLSNGEYYSNNDLVFVQVLPVKWYVDRENNSLISVKGLLSGIKFLDESIKYEGDFSKTKMYQFLNHYMLTDILQSEKIDYELLEEDGLQEKLVKKDESKIQISNDIKLIIEIEYNLAKLKDINYELYLELKEKYEYYLKNNITDITSLGYLNGKIFAEVSCSKERPTDLIEYLKNIKIGYINDFLSNNKRKTNLDLKKIDKIHEKFSKIQSKYSILDKREVSKNLSLIYLLEVYENIDEISLKELEKSYFKDYLLSIITYIKALEDLGIITCSYFISLEDINIKSVFNMINNIEFKNNNKENLIKVLKTL